jgi:hypothetical protein
MGADYDSKRSRNAPIVLQQIVRTMRQRQKPAAIHTEHTMRDQEVLRANKELAAYFRGQRTEREARAALKIIKAFVRGREETDPKNRPPLPGLRAVKAAKRTAPRKPATRTRRRKPEDSPQPSELILPTPSE